jgi:hypothetical protein
MHTAQNWKPVTHLYLCQKQATAMATGPIQINGEVFRVCEIRNYHDGANEEFHLLRYNIM